MRLGNRLKAHRVECVNPIAEFSYTGPDGARICLLETVAIS